MTIRRIATRSSKLLRPLIQRTRLNTCHRFIHSSKYIFSQAGSSGTVYDDFRNILDDSEKVTVKSGTPTGFILSTDMHIKGPIILLNGEVFMWDVPQGDESLRDPKKGQWGLFDGWTKDVFKIFEVVVPRPEMLVLGTGKTLVPLPPKLLEYLHELGIQVEATVSRTAAATFNLLTEENRRVAAALLPNEKVNARTGERI